MPLTSSLPIVRYYTEYDEYYYTTDNRPLYDLAQRDNMLAAAIDALSNSTGSELINISNDTSTDYTLVLEDLGLYKRFNNTLPILVNVPAEIDVPFPVGTSIDIRQVGSGQVLLVAGVGVTLLTPETLKTRKAGAMITILKVSSDTWDVFGDLEIA